MMNFPLTRSFCTCALALIISASLNAQTRQIKPVPEKPIRLVTPSVNSGTFTDGTSTVNFNGTGAQNIPALTYYNLNTSTGDTKTLQGTTTVSNALTINASTTLDLGVFILNLAGAGTPLINIGTFTCGTSTVNFTNAASTTIPALNYFDLNLTGGARVLANSGIAGISGEFITGAGGFTLKTER